VNAFAALNYVSTPVHDVAVTSMSTPSWALKGDIVPITVSVGNQGDFDESFTVTLTDTTAAVQIGQQNISIGPGGSEDVVFQWNTTAAALGNHVLEAVASTVAGETETDDNTESSAVDIQEPVHDVAVIAVDAPVSANVGDTVNVSVTVENQGTYAETTSVSLTDLYDSLTIGSPQAKALNAGDSAVVNFSWDTASEALDTHTLQAAASVVSGETDTADNTMTASTTINEVVEEPSGSPIMVSDLQIDLRSKGPNYQAKATAIIVDENLQPVKGATVTALWEQTAGTSIKNFGTVSGSTNPKGKVSLNTDTVKAVTGDVFTLVILDIVKDGYSFFPTTEIIKSVTVP
jgi:hypothetical protein